MDSCVNYARKAITQALKTYVTTLENGKKYQPLLANDWLRNYIIFLSYFDCLSFYCLYYFFSFSSKLFSISSKTTLIYATHSSLLCSNLLLHKLTIIQIRMIAATLLTQYVSPIKRKSSLFKKLALYNAI